MRAVVFSEFGDPEVLNSHENWPEPAPTEGEVVIDVALAGVNFSDTRLRRLGMQTTVDAGGQPKWIRSEELPIVPGGEILGTCNGGRVVALCGSRGYAERVAVRKELVFPVPDGISDGDAISLFVQGLTALFALRNAGRLSQGEAVAVQAAAGGVGSLAVQLARELGAGAVVGTASTPTKCALATELGATDAVLSGGGVGSRLLAANGGRAFDLILESGGAPEFEELCPIVARFGRLVTLGSASGKPGQVETRSLIAGSRSVVGFWLLDYIRAPQNVLSALEELFGLAASGALTPVPVTRFALEDAAAAHRSVESRGSVGKVVLVV
jgi:NADPH2:quinone reductase